MSHAKFILPHRTTRSSTTMSEPAARPPTTPSPSFNPADDDLYDTQPSSQRVDSSDWIVENVPWDMPPYSPGASDDDGYRSADSDSTTASCPPTNLVCDERLDPSTPTPLGVPPDTSIHAYVDLIIKHSEGERDRICAHYRDICSMISTYERSGSTSAVVALYQYMAHIRTSKWPSRIYSVDITPSSVPWWMYMLMQCILAMQSTPELGTRLTAFAHNRANQLARTEGAGSKEAGCYRAIEAMFKIWPELLTIQSNIDSAKRVLACLDWNDKTTVPVNTCMTSLAALSMQYDYPDDDDDGYTTTTASE